MNHKKEILELMNQFEKGYKEKDQNKLESFMQSVFSSENEISAVDTTAITTESEEWCQGRNAVKTLISDDWKYWRFKHIHFSYPVVFYPPVRNSTCKGTM